MPKSVNRVTLLGNLGSDPTVRTTASGKTVASFSVATEESWKDGSGAWQKRTEWNKVVAWGPLAEEADKMLAKGRRVFVEGRLQSRKWTARDGQERETTEVVASAIIVCSGEPKPEKVGDSGYKPDPGLSPVTTEDDLPF